MDAIDTPKEGKLFRLLLIGFLGQIAGRLVDLQWHLTHEEFEGAAEHFRAHWLIWLSTIFVIGVGMVSVRRLAEQSQRRGYFLVLFANLVYAVLALIHFFQHLDHLEVDWAHLFVAVSSSAAAVGVMWVIAARTAFRRAEREAVV